MILTILCLIVALCVLNSAVLLYLFANVRASIRQSRQITSGAQGFAVVGGSPQQQVQPGVEPQASVEPIIDAGEVERKRLAALRMMPGSLAADTVLRSSNPLTEDVRVSRVVRE
jgi:hypothetical protein